MQAQHASTASRPERDQELAESILAYLADRPRAMDTAEGIARWWLLRQQVLMVMTQVERVLADLTAQGSLEEVGNGPARRYRLKASEASSELVVENPSSRPD